MRRIRETTDRIVSGSGPRVRRRRKGRPKSGNGPHPAFIELSPAAPSTLSRTTIEIFSLGGSRLSLVHEGDISASIDSIIAAFLSA